MTLFPLYNAQAPSRTFAQIRLHLRKKSLFYSKRLQRQKVVLKTLHTNIHTGLENKGLCLSLPKNSEYFLRPDLALRLMVLIWASTKIIA